MVRLLRIFAGFSRRSMKLIAVITLLVMLILPINGCADFQPTPSPEPAEKPAVQKTPATINTEDSAIMAVYEHLLTQAEGYKAKTYLADFYAACDNWTATSELLKDGTTVWYVEVDMTGAGHWGETLYWQQASWLVAREGKVIPSRRFRANALRIEADLQELSLPPGYSKPDELAEG